MVLLLDLGLLQRKTSFMEACFGMKDFIVLLSLFYLRTVGSSLLHAYSTALIGYGYGNKTIRKQSILQVIPYILLVIGIHSIFNLLAFSAQTVHQILGVVTAVMFAFMLFIWVQKKITLLDKIQTKQKETQIID